MSLITDQDVRTFTKRSSLLETMVHSLKRASGSTIVFGKFSPAPLPANGPLIQALKSSVNDGGELFFVIRESSGDNDWIESVAEFLSHDGVSIFVCDTHTSYFPPALVIAQSEVFLHLAWPPSEAKSYPYLGLHLTGNDVGPMARNLSDSIRLASELHGRPL